MRPRRTRQREHPAATRPPSPPSRLPRQRRPRADQKRKTGRRGPVVGVLSSPSPGSPVDSHPLTDSRRYKKKVEKDEDYIRQVKNLADACEQSLMQNYAIDIYQVGQHSTPACRPPDGRRCAPSALLCTMRAAFDHAARRARAPAMPAAESARHAPAATVLRRPSYRLRSRAAPLAPLSA
eukprot:4345477-Prymnesium_polylepis.1